MRGQITLLLLFGNRIVSPMKYKMTYLRSSIKGTKGDYVSVVARNLKFSADASTFAVLVVSIITGVT